MKLGFFGLLSLLLVEICTSFTSSSVIEEILDSVKNIESLMQESCRPNVCCSSGRSRGKKEFMGRHPYGFNGLSMMKSMTPQGFNYDRVQYIDQNIASLRKLKAKLEAEKSKRNKENRLPSMKASLGAFTTSPKNNAALEKPKVLTANTNTNVNSNVNSNLSAVKKAADKSPGSPLPTINPGILKAAAVPKPKTKVEKKVDKNVNANSNTNVNTVNRLMNYDLYDI